MAREARFERADLTGAKLVGCDLLSATLAKARLHGADFTGANLFRADMARVRLDKATRLDGANLLQVRVTQRRSHGP